MYNIDINYIKRGDIMTGEHLRELRKSRKITQVQLAKMLNVQQSSISAWENDTAKPDFDNQRKLSELYGITIDELFGRQVSHVPSAGTKIPVLGRVQAGIPTNAISEIIDYKEIPADMATRGEYFGLLVRGDSMSPDLKDGDVVIVRCQENVKNGEMAIVAVNGDSATVKKVYKSPQGVTLVPINPAYDTKMFTNEEIMRLPVEIRGKVVELRRKIG